MGVACTTYPVFKFALCAHLRRAEKLGIHQSGVDGALGGAVDHWEVIYEERHAEHGPMADYALFRRPGHILRTN